MGEVHTRVHYDSNGTTWTLERVQDVEDIIEENKKLKSVKQNLDWGRHIGTIPNVILEKWFNDEWQRGNTAIRWGSKEFDALIYRKLNDPEWYYLRTDK